MSESERHRLVQQLLTGWNEAVLTRLLILVVGALIVSLTLLSLRHKRCTVVCALLSLIAGGLTIAFSFHPEVMIRFAISTPYMNRIRVVIGAVSVLMLLTTFEAVRRTHLQERYALLWIATGLVLLVAAVFPGVLTFFRAVTGTEYATAVVAVAFTFLVLVAFHFSTSMSAAQTRQTKIAQRVAMLEARVKELEAEKGGKTQEEDSA